MQQQDASEGENHTYLHDHMGCGASSKTHAQGYVSCGHAETARVARQVLSEGGNAVDAAVAATFAASVVEPLLTQLGGGCVITLHVDGRDSFVDAMPHMPSYQAVAEPEQILVRFEKVNQPFWIGRGSVAPPGTLAGLAYAHEKYGTLPWKQVIEPAYHMACEGIRLTAFTAATFKFLEEILVHTPECRKLHHDDDDNLLQEGDLYRNPSYAEFLAYLMEDRARAPDAFRKHYEQCDLPYEAVTVQERKPLIERFDDYDIVTSPTPYPGGLLIAAGIRHYSKLAASAAFDAADASVPAQYVRAANLAASLIEADRIRREKVDGRWNDVDLYENVLGSTTHISVVDGMGNAVSTTSSNGEGAGIMLPCGVQANNLLGERDLHPHGFYKHKPGSCLPSMMSPTLIKTHSGTVIAALGSGGADRIRSALVQSCTAVCSGESLKRAVLEDRVHWDGEHVQLESPDPELGRYVSKVTGMQCTHWNTRSMYFGGVHVASKSGAFADPRRDGATA